MPNKFDDIQMRNIGFSLGKSGLKIMPRDTLHVNNYLTEYVHNCKIYKELKRTNDENIHCLFQGMDEALFERSRDQPTIIYNEDFRRLSRDLQEKIMQERRAGKY
jgi:hypothetical protein